MSRFSVFLLICVCVCCFSCNTQRRLATPKNTLATLSQQLGLKVSRHDDRKLYTEAANWLGTPYRYGGQSRKGVDCSGLIKQIYKNVYEINLARSTNEIATKDCRKIKKGNLKTGDLVFFNTSKKKKKGINHVGLFLKNGYFIHASTSRGVVIDNLRQDYYHQTWRYGGRVK